MRKVVAAGSILVDKINEIGAYPKAGELTQIRALSRVPGGLVPAATSTSSIPVFPSPLSARSGTMMTGVSPLRSFSAADSTRRASW